MAGPLHHAPTTEEADTAAGPATTDPAASDSAGADVADDMTAHGDDPDAPPTAQTAAAGSSDSSSDDHPIPFPPFSEQDELETQSLGAAAAEQEAANTTDVSSPGTALTPLFSAPPSVDGSSQAGEELEADEADRPTEPTEPTGTPEPAETTMPAVSTQLATEPAAEPETEPQPAQPAEAQPDPVPQAVVSPPPAPPPPYWTHSHADPQRNTTSSTSAAALNADRRLANPPLTSAAALSAVAAAGLIPSAAATAASSSSAAPVDASYLPTHHHHHRRDSSSSSSLLRVDLITLQDNEALEQMDQSNCGGGACANGTGAADDRLRALHQQLHRQQRCWARRVDLTDYVIVGGGGSGVGTAGAAGARLGAFVVWTVRVETLEGTAFSIHKRYSEFDALRRQLVASFPQATASHEGGRVTALFGGRRPHPLGGSGGSGSSSSRPASSSGGGGGGDGGGGAFGRSALAGNKKKGRSRSQSRSRKGAPPTALPPLPPKTVLGNFRPAFLEQRRLGLQYFLNCILLNPEFAGSPVLRDFLFS